MTQRPHLRDFVYALLQLQVLQLLFEFPVPEAQEIHAFIRSLIADKYGKEVAENTTILYGGSCNAKNAAGLFANPDIDGGLIGGASLKADDFCAIINAF